MKEVVLKLGLKEVGKGRDMFRWKEEYCMGEEGELDCRRGFGFVFCSVGSWVSL